ncbi:MAG: ABC-2 family transporter protein [Synechocystis sp.]|nr:ABC-2 family transporter protein [Synechocystis sp.]
MRALPAKLSVLLSVYFAEMVEYRAEIFFWILSGSLPLILMGVWVKAAASGDFSLDSLQFARYFFAVFVVRQLTTIWVIWEFEREVIEGKLSFRLLQPLDPVWHHVARHWAEKLTRLPILVIFAGLFFGLYPEAFWLPNPWHFLQALVGIMASFGLYFVIQYTFALCAFWTERASALQDLWFLFYIFLSGIVAPLETFPETVRQIVLLTPFPYGVYFPAAALVGLPLPFFRSLMMIALWGGLILLLNRWLWRRGLRQYSGMGA